jgi:hypothetical protein
MILTITLLFLLKCPYLSEGVGAVKFLKWELAGPVQREHTRLIFTAMWDVELALTTRYVRVVL